MSTPFKPAYLNLLHSGELARRVETDFSNVSPTTRSPDEAQSMQPDDGNAQAAKHSRRAVNCERRLSQNSSFAAPDSRLAISGIFITIGVIR